MRPLLSTCIRTSQVIANLFSDAMFKDNPSGRCHWQDRVFRTLCGLILNPCAEQLDAFDERDASSRNSVFLRTLSSIAIQSGWMEKRSLFTQLQLWQIRKIDSSVLKRAVQLTARNLHREYRKLVELRLDYLMDQWLDGQELEDFPFQLYAADFHSFLRCYQSVIVPAVFLKKNSQILSSK